MTGSASGPGQDPIRLQKVLAQAGMGSRRICEYLIEDQKVTVNGEIAILGRRVNPNVDAIAVDGVTIGVRSDLVHYLLNKPAGVVSTAQDTHDRPTVTEIVPAQPRVYPVGRLDMDTEGLLLITNDGDLTHRLTHPSFGVPKEYLAHVKGKPKRGALRSLREGVELDDGMTAPAQASMVDDQIIRLVIHEGRNRQVRRMCEAVGHPVQRLVRTRIGPLRDGKLGPGQWRTLTQNEVRELEQAAWGTPERPAPDPTSDSQTEPTSGPDQDR